MATTKISPANTSPTTSATGEQSNQVESQLSDFIKHPLQNEWQLWYWRGEKKEWILNLLEVTTFKTVEDFWALYNHIEFASNLKIGSDYCVFKLGIKPMWEDSRNSKGGRWLFTFQKNYNNNKLLNEMWLEVLLCLIGDAFGEESDQICGAVINIRRGVDKIAVWTSDYKDEAAVMKIGRILKQRMNYNGKISYEAHEDTQNKHGQKWLYMIE